MVRDQGKTAATEGSECAAAAMESSCIRATRPKPRGLPGGGGKGEGFVWALKNGEDLAKQISLLNMENSVTSRKQNEIRQKYRSTEAGNFRAENNNEAPLTT